MSHPDNASTMPGGEPAHAFSTFRSVTLERLVCDLNAPLADPDRPHVL
jgi:hypothetical protein